MRYAAAARFVTLAALAGCAYAEISLPESSSKKTTPVAERVASRAVLARVSGGVAPLGCYDAGARLLVGGDACAAMIPDGATLACVGGGALRVVGREPAACPGGRASASTALRTDGAGAGCSVSTWTASGPAPEVIVIPREAPSATPDEARAVDAEAHEPIAQSITLDVDGDGARDRLFATSGALLLAYAGAPQPLVIHRDLAQPRLQGVTDLDGDGRPELWLTTRDSTWTLERVFGGTATVLGRAGCPAPAAGAPATSGAPVVAPAPPVVPAEPAALPTAPVAPP